MTGLSPPFDLTKCQSSSNKPFTLRASSSSDDSTEYKVQDRHHTALLFSLRSGTLQPQGSQQLQSVLWTDTLTPTNPEDTTMFLCNDQLVHKTSHIGAPTELWYLPNSEAPGEPVKLWADYVAMQIQARSFTTRTATYTAAAPPYTPYTVVVISGDDDSDSDQPNLTSADIAGIGVSCTVVGIAVMVWLIIKATRKPREHKALDEKRKAAFNAMRKGKTRQEPLRTIEEVAEEGENTNTHGVQSTVGETQGGSTTEAQATETRYA